MDRGAWRAQSMGLQRVGRDWVHILHSKLCFEKVQFSWSGEVFPNTWLWYALIDSTMICWVRTRGQVLFETSRNRQTHFRSNGPKGRWQRVTQVYRAVRARWCDGECVKGFSEVASQRAAQNCISDGRKGPGRETSLGRVIAANRGPNVRTSLVRLKVRKKALVPGPS